jgi:hypothetical protein
MGGEERVWVAFRWLSRKSSGGGCLGSEEFRTRHRPTLFVHLRRQSLVATFAQLEVFACGEAT